MVWKKAELAALPALKAPRRTKEKIPLWSAAVVEYQGEKVLEIDLFDHSGVLMLRHWVAQGCEKYISLRVQENTWSGGLIASQAPLKNPGSAYYGYIERKPKQNDKADAVLVEWDNGLNSSWRKPLAALNDKEETAARNKRWAARKIREEQAMDLFNELRPEDLAVPDIAEKMARKEIQKIWGAEGWLFYWPYRYKEPLSSEWIKCDKGFCTVCGGQSDLWPSDFPQIERPVKAKGICPMCGAQVQFCRTTKASIASKSSRTVQFKKASTGAALAVQFETTISFSVHREGRERSIEEIRETYPTNVVIFDHRKTVAITATECCGMKRVYSGRWTPYSTVYNLSGTVLPMSDQDLIDTPLENSHVWDYVNRVNYPHTVGYCKNYMKYPLMENLVNAELYHIADQIAFGEAVTKDMIDRKQASPAKALDLTKPELARAKAEHWGLADLWAYKWLRNRELPINHGEILIVAKLRNSKKINDIVSTCNQDPKLERQLYRYLKAQGNKYSTGLNTPEAIDKSIVWAAQIYNDYLKFAEQLGYDLQDPQNRFPAKLKEMHDRLADQVQQMQNAELDMQIKNVAAALERFAWAADGLIIRPARSAAELQMEGKLLHHCVGTYATRYSEGQTALFFIRKKEQPDVPYYTLELNESSMIVVQNHGDHNYLQTTEVKAFEEKWLAWAKKQEAARRAKERKNEVADDCKEKEHAA